METSGVIVVVVMGLKSNIIIYIIVYKNGMNDLFLFID